MKISLYALENQTKLTNLHVATVYKDAIIHVPPTFASCHFFRLHFKTEVIVFTEETVINFCQIKNHVYNLKKFK